jgi:hypothetical protein
MCGGYGVLLIILLLQQQIQARGQKGVWGMLGGDDRNSVAVLGGEAA